MYSSEDVRMMNHDQSVVDLVCDKIGLTPYTCLKFFAFHVKKDQCLLLSSLFQTSLARGQTLLVSFTFPHGPYKWIWFLLESTTTKIFENLLFYV